MRRTPESLPALDSGRGFGLAEIKGRDPMDRRVEVEKKSKYAQELREQMADNQRRLNSGGSGRHRDESPGPSQWGSASARAPSAHGTGSEVFNVESGTWAGGGQPPVPYSPEMNAARSSHRSGCATPLRPEAHDTADKVSQVQDIMRQRLQHLQDEQHKQWQRIQAQLQDCMKDAREAAEQAVQRRMQESLDAQVRPMLEEVGLMRREVQGQSQRADRLVEDLTDLRRAVERLQAESQDHGSQLTHHTSEIERLWAAHQECCSFRAEMQRDIASMRDLLSSVRSEQAEVSQRVADAMRSITNHASEIERLSAAHQECCSFRAELQRDIASMRDLLSSVRSEQAEISQRVADAMRSVNAHAADIDHLKRSNEDFKRFRDEVVQERRATNDAIAQLRSGQEGLSHKVAELPNLIKKLQGDVGRIMAQMNRQPEPAPPPTPAPVPTMPAVPTFPPEVSEDAYALLRNADGELYELPALKNVVGRAASCDAVIAGSQHISNRHACVEFDRDGRASIRDLESRNGLFLNERRVPMEAGLVMESGDSLQLGVDGPTYVFEFGPAYYARWPAEPVRVPQIGGQSGRRDPSVGPGRAPSPAHGSSRRGNGSLPPRR
eukprot:TRINITY_DN15279_c0_g1_i2.p1 TRINITY_DN15279_c0_g1~~TRINITY_DN15279_c0_g1_i2.p1  ORF type:complete len:608 (-),score=118.08 TRINITY_DN15279_c0_g1_i2:106-1929(-)